MHLSQSSQSFVFSTRVSVRRSVTQSLRSFAPLALGLLAVLPAHAQQPADGYALEEIVVTAERREENLQKTAISLTAISGEELQARDVTSIDGALRDVPGVVIQGNANGAYVFIRGIGASQDTAIGGPAVNLNFDGVYQQQTEVPMSSMYDVARVEVLRGPQGTLYGRNATAGSINIITANPVNEYQAVDYHAKLTRDCRLKLTRLCCV